MDEHENEIVMRGDLDALLPPDMARRAEAVGVAKANEPLVRMFVLALLGGAFIAFGALFSVVATTPSVDSAVPYGVGQVLGGVTFSLGLVLVVVAGAELFTGNNLIVMALASRRIRTRALVRSWAIVYVGNVAAAMSVAYVVHLSGALDNGAGAVGRRTIAIATAKTSHTFGQALLLGVLGNVLVCLAIWLCFAARSVTDKVVAIVLPVSAFVAAGFEHSIADAYLVPAGLFAAGKDSGTLTWQRFVIHNLIPVTLGNLIGGAVLVGLVYWFVYLRPSVAPADSS